MKKQNSNHIHHDRDNPSDQGRCPTRSVDDLTDTDRVGIRSGESDKGDQTETGRNDSDGYSEDAGEDEKNPGEKTGKER